MSFLFPIISHLYYITALSHATETCILIKWKQNKICVRNTGSSSQHLLLHAKWNINKNRQRTHLQTFLIAPFDFNFIGYTLLQKELASNWLVKSSLFFPSPSAGQCSTFFFQHNQQKHKSKAIFSLSYLCFPVTLLTPKREDLSSCKVAKDMKCQPWGMPSM